MKALVYFYNKPSEFIERNCSHKEFRDWVRTLPGYHSHQCNDPTTEQEKKLQQLKKMFGIK
jgi:hypothetical protein